MIEIETQRLLVRTFKEGDYQDLYEYLSNPEIYIFEPGQPISLEEARLVSAERAKGSDFYAVVLKSSRIMVGHVYFARVEPMEYRTWEIGYIFNPAFQRKGYATEAVRALVEYAFRNFEVHRIMARCNPLNPASWKLLEKIGFRKKGLFIQCGTFRNDDAGNPIWHDAYEYGLLKEDLDKT